MVSVAICAVWRAIGIAIDLSVCLSVPWRSLLPWLQHVIYCDIATIVSLAGRARYRDADLRQTDRSIHVTNIAFFCWLSQSWNCWYLAQYIS